ncbi:MAG: OB-fold nucleic acid binding domain-containing protein, partial [Halobacteriales archaeon]
RLARLSVAERRRIDELDDHVGDRVALEAEVTRTYQTSGPTIFTLSDETGSVDCAAFERAGVRAYPDVETGDYVRLVGEVETREGELQVETESIDALDEEERREVESRIESVREEEARPPELEPLVESETLEALYPDVRETAAALRRAVMTERPIVVRHHADADGITSGAMIERAVLSLIDEHNDDPEARYHLFRRMPSKAPFYEIEDATRDLNNALRDRERHGHELPLLLIIDNGSTEEDVPAYEMLGAYDVPIYVVDHHSPSDVVDEHVERHVNPYLVGGDYSITSGMICAEVARHVDPDVESDVRHLPAVAGTADRSEADEMTEYREIALRAGYSSDDVSDIADAVDFQSYHLRYDDGRHLVNAVLDVGDQPAHEDLVEDLVRRADEAFEQQKSAAIPAVERAELSNGATFAKFDVENHTQRFTYPGPGKTTGAVHDELVEDADGAVVTVGYGPDFAVVRGHGIEIDIPEIVSELQVEVKGAAVDGGGHLVVGSLKFVRGLRDEVLEALERKVEEAKVTA